MIYLRGPLYSVFLISLLDNTSDVYDGLYVVGGSVIPCYLPVNPSFTVCALAERCMRLCAADFAWRMDYDVSQEIANELGKTLLFATTNSIDCPNKFFIISFHFHFIFISFHFHFIFISFSFHFHFIFISFSFHFHYIFISFFISFNNSSCSLNSIDKKMI